MPFLLEDRSIVLFLLSFPVTMTVLSHRKPVSAGTAYDIWCAYEGYERNILYKNQSM